MQCSSARQEVSVSDKHTSRSNNIVCRQDFPVCVCKCGDDRMNSGDFVGTEIHIKGLLETLLSCSKEICSYVLFFFLILHLTYHELIER